MGNPSLPYLSQANMLTPPGSITDLKNWNVPGAQLDIFRKEQHSVAHGKKDRRHLRHQRHYLLVCTTKGNFSLGHDISFKNNDQTWLSIIYNTGNQPFRFPFL